MHFIRVVHYFFGISLTAHFVLGGSYSDVETLVNDKLNKYNNNLRPRLDQDDKVEVSVGFMVISYKEIDEIEGEFSVSGTLILTWTDEFLQWDPTKYNGTTNFSIDSSQVWTPSLSMFNNVNSNSMILQADQVLYYNSGYAVFVTHPQFTVPCAIDVQLYPWDSHTCFMMLIPRNPEHGLSLLKFYDDVNTDYLTTSNGWELVYTNVTSNENMILVFLFNLKRKALFSVLNTIFPILFMTGLSLMVFVVPTDSGERLSFCTTVLLSVLVFLSLVGDSLPKSTAAISFLSIFLVVLVFVNVLITISTVISMHVYFKDDNVPVGKFWVMLEYVTSMRWFQPRFWSSKRSNKTGHAADARPNEEGQFQNQTNQYPQRIFASTISYNGNGNEDIPVNEVSSEDDSNDDSTHCDLAASQKQNRPVNTKNEPDGVKKEKGVVTWKDVSITLDRLFFVVYTVVIVVVCIVFGKLVMP